MDAEHKKEYWQRMLPNLVLLTVLLLSLFLFSGCTVVESQANREVARVLRIATDYEEGDLGYQQLQIFAQSVSEKSNNTLEVQLYAADRWSKAESFIEYLDAGALEMACLPLAQAKAIQPAYAIYEQPYLFANLQAVERYITGSNVQKSLQLLPQSYCGIGMVADGYGYWVPQISTQMLSYGEVKHLAEVHELQSGVVYDVQAVYNLHPLIVSQQWWAVLTEQERLWIEESFQESLKSIFVYQKEIAPQRLLESGAVVMQALPIELSGVSEQWISKRDSYFLSHADILTAYWRPMVTAAVIGEEM